MPARSTRSRVPERMPCPSIAGSAGYHYAAPRCKIFHVRYLGHWTGAGSADTVPSSYSLQVRLILLFLSGLIIRSNYYP